MGVTSTVAGIVTGLAGAAQGHEAARAGRSANRRQGQAQAQAKARAASQQRANQIAQNQANRKKPDLAAILAAANQPGVGIGSTLLTGPNGVPDHGRSTRLGDTGRLG